MASSSDEIRRFACVRGLLAVVSTLALLTGGGCGGGDETSTSSTAAVETLDELPELPPGWRGHANRVGGYAIGVPPGWSVSDRGARTEMRSPERLAAVSITVDRTDEVLAVPLEQLATATIAAGIPGLSSVKPSEPRPFRQRYDAMTLEATGVGGDEDVPERLVLAVVRRPGIATFSVLAAVNAKHRPGFYSDEVDRIIRTLRSRPIAPP